MNIGLLSFEYPPETGFGGIGTYTWYQARALARLGHSVHVLAGLKEASDLYTREHDGVLVHRYWSGGRVMKAFDALGKWKWWWTRQRLENGWSMYQSLKVLSEKYRFDVLEMPECGAEGYLINNLLRIPTVVRFHSPSRLIMPFYDVQPGDVTWCSFIEQRAINAASALTSCSSFLAGEVRAKLGVRGPVEVIPNGIDLALFDQEERAEIAGKYGWPRDKVTIFFAGRMERRKGIHLCGEIAQAILRKHDVAFVFAGQDLFGYMKDQLLPSLAGQQLRGSVHYLGKLDLPELRSCVRAADIFMLPSLWENCPYSCLEAMAAGRAIVSSDQGGMPDLIQDGVNGLLARCDDAESYVQQLDRLITDATLRHRLGAEARRSVEQRYTDDAIARQTADVYERCVTDRRGSVPKSAGASA
jgi:glycosyltransferase involved in cell wall biosynthesis